MLSSAVSLNGGGGNPQIRKCFFQHLGLLYEPEVKPVVLTSTQVLNGKVGSDFVVLFDVLLLCDSVSKLT